MTFDRACQVAAADGFVFYGSSVDGVLYALHADSGQVAWEFFTDAPIRFAPAVWRDRLFVVSDDGHLYALAIRDGRLLWKQRGGPNHSAVLGNQRLVSKWPARGGPVVADDVVYFAAGIWPSDGIYLYALDAESGRVLWCNDDSGGMYMPQPHGGADAASGVAAQGYLAVSGDLLFVPTGRAVPAAFDRHSGKFLYFHLQRYGQDGSAAIAAIDGLVFNSGHAFDAQTGDKALTIGRGEVAITPEFVARGTDQAVEVSRLVETEKVDRRGSPVPGWALERQFTTAGAAADSALIATGDKIVCGTSGRVQMIDVAAQQPTWSAALEGAACGLAIADSRLLVSTDRGLIYCFAGGAAGSATTDTAAAGPAPPERADATDARYTAAADEILRRLSGEREGAANEKAGDQPIEGYCVDLACGDGRLAQELAERTELMIYAVDGDPARVEAARRRLRAAGLYGSRVMVQLRDPGDSGLPSYFADLVVSGRSVTEGAQVLPRAEAERLQRPHGGVLCLGPPEDLLFTRRDGLPGAGSWTHQYADPANSLCSGDQMTAGSLGMLWFRDLDFDLPNRHGRAPAPLYDRGRVYHQGLDGIVAVDAYNGRELWRYAVPGVLRAYDGDELMGTAGTGSNLCVHGDSVYLRHGSRCLRLDAATGRLVAEFPTPPGADGQSGTWGYLAAADGILFGSVADTEHIVTYRYQDRGGDMSQLFTESRSLFAMDAESGRLLWQYPARHSIRHNAIAISRGRVTLIDRPQALFDRQKRPESKEHPQGLLVALDARSGQQLWQAEDEIYGTLLAASDQHDVLLMAYQATRFRLDSEFGGRLAAFRGSDGKRLWDVPAKYDSRPLINGQTVYAQGGAWDLLTGESQAFNFQRSYGCGILAASQNLMVFRSATLGYFDFRQSHVQNYGGIRPGCWVNALPAGGLVLVPEASAGCRCSYLNQAWIALLPEP